MSVEVPAHQELKHSPYFLVHFQLTFGMYLSHQLADGSAAADPLSAGAFIRPELHGSWRKISLLFTLASTLLSLAVMLHCKNQRSAVKHCVTRDAARFIGVCAPCCLSSFQTHPTYCLHISLYLHIVKVMRFVLVFFVMKCLWCRNAVLLFGSKTIKYLEEAYWLVFFSSPQTILFYYTHHTHTGCGTSTAASNPGYIIPCNTKAKQSNVVMHAQYDSILVVTWKIT